MVLISRFPGYCAGARLEGSGRLQEMINGTVDEELTVIFKYQADVITRPAGWAKRKEPVYERGKVGRWRRNKRGMDICVIFVFIYLLLRIL